MKRLLQTIITLILLLSPMCVAASLSAYALWVSKLATIDSLDDKKESPRRQRIPTQPIECIITSDGIYIHDSSVNLAEAISYEIWDAESEWCVASFSDEFSFIESLLQCRENSKFVLSSPIMSWWEMWRFDISI